jgi:hypothetical protein
VNVPRVGEFIERRLCPYCVNQQPGTPGTPNAVRWRGMNLLRLRTADQYADHMFNVHPDTFTAEVLAG